MFVECFLLFIDGEVLESLKLFFILEVTNFCVLKLLESEEVCKMLFVSLTLVLAFYIVFAHLTPNYREIDNVVGLMVGMSWVVFFFRSARRDMRWCEASWPLGRSFSCMGSWAKLFFLISFGMLLRRIFIIRFYDLSKEELLGYLYGFLVVFGLRVLVIPLFWRLFREGGSLFTQVVLLVLAVFCVAAAIN